jgi:hypothetical protein
MGLGRNGRFAVAIRAAVLAMAAATWASSGGVLQAADAKVVFQDDFERPTPSNPPPGWSMWGAAKYKIPANYTRDTGKSHGGKASFRIHQPAGTEGYVVSAPDRAIRPHADKLYTVTFWARSDRPGEALFGWTAYRQAKPLVDAPSPGTFPIRVSPEWTMHRFALYEGWEFFAEECRLLLLTFHAAGRPSEERTL